MKDVRARAFIPGCFFFLLLDARVLLPQWCGRCRGEKEREWLWEPVDVGGLGGLTFFYFPTWPDWLSLKMGLQQRSSHMWSLGNGKDMDECLRHQCIVGSFWSSLTLEWGRGDAVCLSVMLLSQPAGVTANSDLLNLCKPAQYRISPLRTLLHKVLFQRAVSDWFFSPPIFFLYECFGRKAHYSKCD